MTDRSSSYSPEVLDHFIHPRNMGELAGATVSAEAVNAVCGDTMRAFLKVADGIVVDARFTSFGCGASIAAASIVTERLRGQPLRELKLRLQEALQFARDGLPKVKAHCTVMVESAFTQAIEKCGSD